MYPKTTSAFLLILFTYSFSHSFNKYLWSSHYMSGPKLGIRFLVSVSWHMTDYWHKLNLLSINNFIDSVSWFISFSLPGNYFSSQIFKLTVPSRYNSNPIYFLDSSQMVTNLSTHLKIIWRTLLKVDFWVLIWCSLIGIFSLMILMRLINVSVLGDT